MAFRTYLLLYIYNGLGFERFVVFSMNLWSSHLMIDSGHYKYDCPEFLN
jgi:hypothetical protein